jgi:hypothetical protein
MHSPHTKPLLEILGYTGYSGMAGTRGGARGIIGVRHGEGPSSRLQLQHKEERLQLQPSA